VTVHDLNAVVTVGLVGIRLTKIDSADGKLVDYAMVATAKQVLAWGEGLVNGFTRFNSVVRCALRTVNLPFACAIRALRLLTSAASRANHQEGLWNTASVIGMCRPLCRRTTHSSGHRSLRDRLRPLTGVPLNSQR